MQLLPQSRCWAEERADAPGAGPPSIILPGTPKNELHRCTPPSCRWSRGVVPSLLAGEQLRQHGASQLGDDEPQALALNQALDDQPRSGPCAVAGGPGACRKAEQCN